MSSGGVCLRSKVRQETESAQERSRMNRSFSSSLSKDAGFPGMQKMKLPIPPPTTFDGASHGGGARSKNFS